MFLTDCTSCGLRELRGARSVTALINTDHAIGLYYTCTRCRAANVLVTGAQSAAPRPATARAA